MFFKLSFRNMQRSLSDYAIYFLSITLAVALFYVFNSIYDQKVLLELNASQLQSLASLEHTLAGVSFLVSFVFFALCLYANQFMMKRRKKEWGLYMILGMSKKEISHLLIFETILLGLLALVVGLGVGILLSQGMSAFTASLFDVSLTQYSFLFSSSALFKSILFFSSIFALVVAFNTLSLSRYALIDLLTASKKNSDLLFKKQVFPTALSIFSLLLVCIAYVTLATASLSYSWFQSLIGFGLLLLGSILFYIAFPSFVLRVLSKKKQWVLHNLNAVHLRQLIAKVKPSLLAMLSIHFLLLFTITILTSGFSYKYAMEQQLKILAPYDVSIQILNFNREPISEYSFFLERLNIDPNNHPERIVGYNLYESDLTLWDTLYEYADLELQQYLSNGFHVETQVIGYSDYQALMRLQGQEPLTLGPDEVLLVSNLKEALSSIETMASSRKEYTIAGTTLSLAEEGYQVLALKTESYGSAALCFVVPDVVTQSLSSKVSILNLQYFDNSDQLEPQYREQFIQLSGKDVFDNNYLSASGTTKSATYEDVSGFAIQLIYIGIFLGLVFLVTSGAVLGLKLLSDANEEIEMYQTLQRMGASNKQMHHAILLQIGVAFLFPLALAIPHSIVLVDLLNRLTGTLALSQLVTPIAITTILLCVLYGSYLWISYRGYLKIIFK